MNKLVFAAPVLTALGLYLMTQCFAGRILYCAYRFYSAA